MSGLSSLFLLVKTTGLRPVKPVLFSQSVREYVNRAPLVLVGRDKKDISDDRKQHSSVSLDACTLEILCLEFLNTRGKKKKKTICTKKW